VESNLERGRITFEVLQRRLLSVAARRIQNGEYTERGLARILGVSQPQIHNVLKGARKLHFLLADRLLNKFSISALDLLNDGELNEALCARNATSTDHQPTFSNDARPMEFSSTSPATKKPASRSKFRGSSHNQRAS
jgi:plasmid maintenance system antidote protein VapI